MIDYLHIKVEPEAIAVDDMAALNKSLGLVPPFNRREVKVSGPTVMGVQHLDVYPHHVELRMCPEKLMGRWNCLGSNDLMQVVRDSTRAMFVARGVDIPPSIKKAIWSGNFRLKGLDLTEHFWLRGYDISDFIVRTMLALVGAYVVEPIKLGVGFRIDARSRRREVLVYNKRLQFQRLGLRHYDQRIASTDGIARAGWQIDRAVQQYAAAVGPRLEVKLGDHYFTKSNILRQGLAWMPDTAALVYQKELASLAFPKAVDALFARQAAQRMVRLGTLSPAAFRTFLLAMHHEPLSVVGTGKTLKDHADQIEAAVGIDIRRPLSRVYREAQVVDASKVFSWDNRFEPDKLDIDRDLGSLEEHVPL